MLVRKFFSYTVRHPVTVFLTRFFISKLLFTLLSSCSRLCFLDPYSWVLCITLRSFSRSYIALIFTSIADCFCWHWDTPIFKIKYSAHLKGKKKKKVFICQNNEIPRLYETSQVFFESLFLFIGMCHYMADSIRYTPEVIKSQNIFHRHGISL